MTTEEHDVFADAETEVSADGLERIAQMLRRRNEVAGEAERLAVELRLANEELARFDELRFPELFEEVGVTAFEDEDGNRLEVAEKMYGSLPKTDPETRMGAMAEIERLEGDGLIKAIVSVAYAKGGDEEARQIYDMLIERGLPAELKEDIHPQTLQAWAREQLEAGVDINLELLGLRLRRALKITKPRKSRKK